MVTIRDLKNRLQEDLDVYMSITKEEYETIKEWLECQEEL